MRQNDARQLSHDMLEDMRRRAVMAVQEGQSPEAVGKAFGLNRTTIYDWLGADRRGGWGGFKAQAVGRLLAQLGITPQRPLYQALERDTSLVKKWLKTEFPKIKKAAETLGADIYFGDAAHIRSDHHAGRTWGKKGEKH